MQFTIDSYSALHVDKKYIFMKSLLFTASTIAILFFSFTQDHFTTLRRLEGTWIMETKNGRIGEVWTVRSNSELAGRGITIRGMDTIDLEKVTLIRRPAGIFYESLVVDQNNGKAVAFKLVSSENGRVVFENKQHDFPTLIVYNFVGTDSLVASIEGLKQGKPERSSFRYRRVR